VLLSVLASMGLCRIGQVFESLLIIAVLLSLASIYYSLYVFVKLFRLGYCDAPFGS
jgi:hypothetical protein